MTDIEEWRAVVGRDGYEVSDQGRVRSVLRVITRVDGKRKTFQGKDLKTTALPKGYLMVSLGTSMRAYVHHLVLEAFVGPRPEGMEACHCNGDPADNRLVNLRWDTPAANNRDKRAHGTDHNARKAACPRGHLLQHPNLVAHQWRAAGHRGCRACAQAQAYRQRHPETNFEAEANRRYLIITNSSSEAS